MSGSLVSPKGGEAPLLLCDAAGVAEHDCISPGVDDRRHGGSTRGPLLSLGSLPRVGVIQEQGTSPSLSRNLEITYFCRLLLIFKYIKHSIRTLRSRICSG